MRVVTSQGESIELGTTAAAPTISLVDYSRRTTDAFGVTTVVKRDFSRTMSVQLGVAFDDVDTLQRRLAGLRASEATWIADERFGALAVRGFFKDFSLDLATAPLSRCSLSIEGLAESTGTADSGVDPAPDGQASTFQILQPVTVTDNVLVASNILENDAPEWVGNTKFAKGARVIRSPVHRVYESLVPDNENAEPSTTPAKWLDVGPTSRWAMFDQALGTTSKRGEVIEVSLDAGAIGAVALLDVVGLTVRVRARNYDRTVAVGAGAITFLDLPADAGVVTVTIAGGGTVSVGTLLVGRMAGLGITEASPTAGITDYSKKTVDAFGGITVVPRSFAKRMTTRTLIATAAIDAVVARVAALRARPILWIGSAGVDSLTVFGFFKSFSADVGDQLSTVSLEIEGLSTAAAAPTRSPSLIVDRGAYDAATVYELGDVVLSKGSSWKYIAATAASGHEPPLLPIEQDAWWRVFARAGTNGTNGANALSMLLTNEAHTLPADAGSSVTSYAGATGSAVIYAGAADVSGLFTLSTLANPQALAVTYSGRGYTITGGFDANEENASLTIRATGSGAYAGVTIDKVFSLAKSRAGASGAAAKLLVVTSTSQTLTVDASGALAPSGTAQNIVFSALRQNTTAAITWSVKDQAGTTHISAEAASLTLAAGDMLSVINAAPNGRSLTVTATLVDAGQTLSDTISVAKVQQGADGAKGNDGAKGETGGIGTPGRDGTTWYAYFAYANSADGVVDFTTGLPGTRAYVGQGQGTSPTEPESPSFYSWSPYKGPPFGLSTRGNAVVAGDQVIKNGGPADWNSDAFSTVGFRAAVASFRLITAGQVMAGLNTDPLTDPGPNSIDYAVYRAGGTAYAFESGNIAQDLGACDDTTRWTVEYTGNAIVYTKNGAIVRGPIAVTAGQLFYFDSSFLTPSTRIIDIGFTARGEAGADAYSVTLSQSAIILRANSDGSIKSGELPRTFGLKVMRGSTDVTGGASVVFGASDGAITATYASGVISLTGGTTGWLDAAVKYGSLALGTYRVTITVQRDAPPPSSQTSAAQGFNAIAGTASYDEANATPSLSLKTSATGQIAAAAYGEYYATGAATAVLRIAGKLQYRAAGTGGWIDAQAEVAGSEANSRRDGDSTPGSITLSVTISNLTASVFYEVRAIFRRNGGTAGGTGAIIGDMSAHL